MATFRTFLMIAVLTAGSAAVAEPPGKAPAAPAEKKTDKAAEKKVEKPVDKPASDGKTAKADDKSAKKEALSEAETKRILEFFDKLVAVVVANKEDCTKMAADLNAHLDANQALLKEVAEARNRELPQAVKDKIAKKTADELAPAMMVKCSNDRAVMNAFMRIKPPAAK